MIYFFVTGIVEGGNGYRYNLIQDMEGGDGRAERKYCNKQVRNSQFLMISNLMKSKPRKWLKSFQLLKLVKRP